MSGTNEITPEWRERSERNLVIITGWRAANEIVFNELLEADFFSYPDTIADSIRFYKGGIVRCKICEQEYKWKDWMYIAHASGRMAHHLRRKHRDRLKEISSKEYPNVLPGFLQQWLDKQLTEEDD